MTSTRNLAYSLLKQETDSDDDFYNSEDDVIFSQQSKDHLEINRKHDETIEMEIMGREKLNVIKPPNMKYIKVSRKSGAIVTIILVLLIGVISVFSIPIINWKHPSLKSTSLDWLKEYNDTSSESIIRLIDIDGDGIDDVLVGMLFDVSSLVDTKEKITIQERCKLLNLSYPCIGTMLAYRGYDGKELWRVKIRSGVLFISCHELMVNEELKKVCIVSGRSAMLTAIDIKSGKVWWTSESEEFFNPNWNTYQVIKLPDLTSDGIPEFLVANGGNPDYESTDHKRECSRLVLISGINGKPLGKTYLNLPKLKETYMTPVLYSTPEGSYYILFGTGGETVQGDLMAISLPDFYHHVTQSSAFTPVPGVKTSNLYTDWSDKFRQDGDMFNVYSGKTKGILVPPVLVDVNHDNITDLLVSLFEGKLVLLDGKTLDEIWSVEFNNCESYSTPAPGFFNEDNYLDFMVHFSEGMWPAYKYTRTLIISGEDGRILWQMITDRSDMSSDLVVKTTEHGDLFIFKSVGRIGSQYSVDTVTGNLKHHEKTSLTSRNRRHTYTNGHSSNTSVANKTICERQFQIYHEFHSLCGENLDKFTEEMFAIGRATNYRPIKLDETVATEFQYDMKLKPDTYHCHTDKVTVDHVTNCVILKPEGRLTGAISDLTGKGDLDLLTLSMRDAKVIDDLYNYVKMTFSTKLSRINLKQALLNGKITNTSFYLNVKSLVKASNLKNIQFLSKSKQKWLEYLGSNTNSGYTE